MKRTWIAMVLLAGSWLFGLSYYHAANGWLWAAAVAGAVVLLSGTSRLRPRRPFALAAIVLLLPALWVMRWPFKAVPLLVAGGLALHLAPIPVKWPRRLGTAMIESGLDGIQALQPTCKGMTPADLKEQFGKQIVLMGAVDTQLLIDGTPDQAREETRRVIDIMKPGGGFICSPSHDYLLPETPVENVAAHYQAIRDFGSYSS